MKNYDDWNSHFEDEFSKISAERRCKPGAFLSVVPNCAEWENYLDFIRREWRFGRITEFPFCLLTLYAGVAFHDYESGDFWKPFAAAVGVKSISPAQYHQLTDFFLQQAKEIGLETLVSSRGKDFVGSAIFQIGVPLSFWQDFLKICENLWWREDWKSFSSDEWETFVTRKVGGLARLKRFLVGNPQTARRFVAPLPIVNQPMQTKTQNSSFLTKRRAARALSKKRKATGIKSTPKLCKFVHSAIAKRLAIIA